MLEHQKVLTFYRFCGPFLKLIFSNVIIMVYAILNSKSDCGPCILEISCHIKTCNSALIPVVSSKVVYHWY